MRIYVLFVMKSLEKTPTFLFCNQRGVRIKGVSDPNYRMFPNTKEVCQ